MLNGYKAITILYACPQPLMNLLHSSSEQIFFTFDVILHSLDSAELIQKAVDKPPQDRISPIPTTDRKLLLVMS